MLCTKCGLIVETAGEIRACATCSHHTDGTARQVPADLEDAAAIETVIVRVSGLGNRFVPGHTPAPAAVNKDPEAERILREERAQKAADAQSAHSRFPGPEEAVTKTNAELKAEKVEQELREERERGGDTDAELRQAEAERDRERKKREEKERLEAPSTKRR